MSINYCYKNVDFLKKEIIKYSDKFDFFNKPDYYLSVKNFKISQEYNDKKLINIIKMKKSNIIFIPKESIILPLVEGITMVCEKCKRVYFISLLKENYCPKCK